MKYCYILIFILRKLFYTPFIGRKGVQINENKEAYYYEKKTIQNVKEDKLLK